MEGGGLLRILRENQSERKNGEFWHYIESNAKGIWDTGHKECHNNLWSAHTHHRPKEVECPRKNLGYPGLEYFSCSKNGYGCFGIL